MLIFPSSVILAVRNAANVHDKHDGILRTLNIVAEITTVVNYSLLGLTTLLSLTRWTTGYSGVAYKHYSSPRLCRSLGVQCPCM